MEIKPEDELSNIVLFPVKEDDPRNQVNFLYETSGIRIKGEEHGNKTRG
ncbi:hypothetical protein [Escherichia coli]|nr:hypothetical protein [Escherichia coli]